MAVSLGYRNVFRYPEGFPQWLERGLPVTTIDFLNGHTSEASTPLVPVPSGLYLLLILGAVFIGGVALNLTPCVYPLIPITVSYFGGRSATVQGSKVLHGIFYILGLSLTNSTLGVIAALTGGLVGSLLQSSVVLIGIASVLLIFALSLFGLWEIRLPPALNALAARSYSGYGGSLFMGLTLGIIAAPCIGPFVIGLLTWIASIGEMWFGFTVFFILSVGMGLPLFVLAVFSSNIDRLPRSGKWMIWIKKLMGWILLGMATYFVGPILSEAVRTLGYSVIAIAAALHLGWLERSGTHSPGFAKLKKTIGICCLCFAVMYTGQYVMRGPGVSWVQFSETVLSQAMEEGKPVIIDFYAAWCTPCRKLDATTFHNKNVVHQLQQVVMIKIDLTSGATAEYEDLIDQFQIKGVPTIIFIDSSGKERRDLRLVDYLSPEDFTQQLDKFL